jgi:hypothetical protein
LRNTLAKWDLLLVKTPGGKQARLLEAFAATHPKGRTGTPLPGVLAHGKQKQEKQQ